MRAVVTWAVMALLASADSSATLTVRLYNTAGIPPPQLLAARLAAESILRDTGLNVSFRQCGRPVLPEERVDPCDDFLKPSEVVVRVIDAPPFNATLRPEAYGVSYVVRETNHGWLATVFSDRIESAATRVGVETGTLLGRVIAHEVGHLLLGSGYHGEAGVMRAEWPDALLNREGDEWRFSVLEAAGMQRALTSIIRQPFENDTAPIHFGQIGSLFDGAPTKSWRSRHEATRARDRTRVTRPPAREKSPSLNISIASRIQICRSNARW